MTPDSGASTAEPARPSTVAGPVLLYDGVCGFCVPAVKAILRVDKRGSLRFAAVQSDYGQQIIGRHPSLQGVESAVFVEHPGEPGRELVYLKSDASLRIRAYLAGSWRIMLVMRLVPRGIRDRFYDAFARNRYRLFGMYDSCHIPAPEVRARFLDNQQ